MQPVLAWGAGDRAGLLSLHQGSRGHMHGARTPQLRAPAGAAHLSKLKLKICARFGATWIEYGLECGFQSCGAVMTNGRASRISD